MMSGFSRLRLESTIQPSSNDKNGIYSYGCVCFGVHLLFHQDQCKKLPPACSHAERHAWAFMSSREDAPTSLNPKRRCGESNGSQGRQYKSMCQELTSSQAG
eukprot:5183289-Amphidinium_carterae.1